MTTETTNEGQRRGEETGGRALREAADSQPRRVRLSDEEAFAELRRRQSERRQ